jgi:hypothetical protein
VAGVGIAAISAVPATATFAASPAPGEGGRRGSVELLEDDAQGLLAKLTNADGGPASVESKDVYSGRAAIKIVPMQRYQRNIPGWSYRITREPAPGEYRFLRFAWRADGARGIMVQMHDEKDWNLRFTAGVDEFNWGTKFVAPAPPAAWTVVTRDLYDDFGGRTLHGLALTVFGGKAGYFDHMYLGRTIDDLDRVDATGISAAPPRLGADDLNRLWMELADGDAPREYRAFWTLKATPRQSLPFLRQALAASRPEEEMEQVRRWVVDLDSADYRVREEATIRLADHMEAAAELLRRQSQDATPEARMRIQALLASDNGRARSDRLLKAVRLVEYMDSREARALLKELSEGPEGSAVTRAAKAAAGRSEKSPAPE